MYIYIYIFILFDITLIFSHLGTHLDGFSRPRASISYSQWPMTCPGSSWQRFPVLSFSRVISKGNIFIDFNAYLNIIKRWK